MTARHYAIMAALLAGCAGMGGHIGRLAHGQAVGEAEEGKRVFMRANCMGCHKWHGGGGGGYGGDALSLRNTQLDRDQIVETVSCGRPGTGMPYFLRDAYGANHCYGSTKEDMGSNMPPAPGVFLRPNEVQAVADYVLAHVKGKGEPNLAQCL